MEIAIFIGVLILFMIISYNSLVNKRNSVDNALSTIDTCLQTRLDLMSTLFEQIDIAYDHESKIFKELVELRTKQEGIKEKYSKENKNIVVMDKEISNLNKEYLMVCENYPELRSIEAVAIAMNANVEVENQINAARRNYNNNVQNYRNGIQSFPNVIFAGLLGFRNKYELYKADDGSEKRVSPRNIIK